LDIWEEKLIDEMKQGSHEAFERCYRLFSSQIYTVIIKVCRNEETAGELLQDTFLEVFESINCYKFNQSFAAWIKKIAFNKTLNFIKRNQRMVLMDEMPEEVELVECLPSKQTIDSQLIEKVFEHISEIERLILWLFIVEQYSHEEIAVLVSKTPSYSKSIVSRTLKKIRLTAEVKGHAYQ